ncbi:E3 ubiquitin-protein ligase RNFT1 isoform X2 [Ambystoma mexicanum]|uniref:E3 ubiquitin-protein ligase RNFT1 isoform X2 n=1 Tax=Ambystoma mexicanum TaxID=8296 RepID=UPI0037E7240F
MGTRHYPLQNAHVQFPGSIRHRSSETKDSDDQKLLMMQTSSSQNYNQPSNENSDTSSGVQTPSVPRLPLDVPCLGSEVHIQLEVPTREDGERRGSRYQRPNSHTHTHGHAHASSTGDTEDTEPGEHSSAMSEFRCVFQWLQKSLPYILILCAKIILQHILGISVGIGLLTTFLYANKSIVNQVFLREKSSRLQCLWLLVFLGSSSALLYYSFLTEALYYSLIFLNPSVGFLHFWDVLWIVGITDFILKFSFMGFKCLVLLVPSFVMSYKCKGYCYMFLEEFGQYYRILIPIPVWFRYLIGSKELDSVTGWSLGILLALFYLIIKILELFTQWKTFKKIMRVFFARPYGVPATKRQCSEAEDICPICQVDFTKPIALVCQHIFCEECIALWFNREKTCPLCRTVIADHVYKWKDGATSPHLQVY